MKQAATQDLVYNIGAVARMTGISIATLRAWERRYGFPRAGRSAGGHRLYSEGDVSGLRWIKAQLDGGLRPSKAIEAWQHHKGEILEPAASAPANQPMGLEVFHRQLFQALAAHDTARADHILGEALLAHNLDNIMLDVIGPAMADIGQAWMDGRLDVATEHLATNYLRHRLQTWALSSAPPRQVAPVVLACAPGEWHEGGLLILAALLRRRRWPVVYLGQSVPLPDLAKLAGEVKPQIIVLSATLEESARALAELPKWLPAASGTGQPVVAYGGQAFDRQPEWRARVPGTFLGQTLREGLQALESMIQAKGGA
ncbi:MAG: MerR family DNA-binding transcriptional regulator [Thermoflexales bacterium]|nr:MerR family DNA-binding transcriptional regulator [Thermoflexales bacterium]